MLQVCYYRPERHLNNIVRICASCTKINAGEEDLEAFHRAVEAGLRQRRPDLQWQAERSPCLKVCPIGQITMTVSLASDPSEARLTMSRVANVESVVDEVLSFFRK